MKLCPNCGKIADYSSYFGAYLCNQCDWRDNKTSIIEQITEIINSFPSFKAENCSSRTYGFCPSYCNCKECLLEKIRKGIR